MPRTPLALAFGLLVLLPLSPLSAQSAVGTTVPVDGSPLNGITLDTRQRGQVDSLSKIWRAKVKAAVTKEDPQQTQTSARTAANEWFFDELRKILTPDQQAIWDTNLKARRGPGNQESNSKTVPGQPIDG